MRVFKRLRLALRFFRTSNDFDYAHGFELLEDKWGRLHAFLSSDATVAAQSKESLEALARVLVLLKRHRMGCYLFNEMHRHLPMREQMQIEDEEWVELWDLVKNYSREWWD